VFQLVSTIDASAIDIILKYYDPGFLPRILRYVMNVFNETLTSFHST
jgi:hypothetical protein